jgi:hypothetical protein
MSSGTAAGIGARDQGADFQARLFWFEALRLLDPHPRLERVGIEQGEYKHFDDIVCFYKDGLGLDRDVDCHQVKFHVWSDGSITWANVMSPEWIGAKELSLMQRLLIAHKRHNGRAHLYLTSPWQPHPDDSIAGMVDNVNEKFVVEKLLRGGPRSANGKVRASLLAHTGSSEDDLLAALGRWRIRVRPSLEAVQQNLDDRLARHHFQPVGNLQANVYDDLARKLIQSQTPAFNATTLLALMESEGLVVRDQTTVAEPWRVGIRSFAKQAVYLEEEMDELLDFLDLFDGRDLRPGVTWNNDVRPRIRDFVSRLDDAQRDDVELHLHCKISIAYAAGCAVSSKSSTRYSVRQGGSRGAEIWRLSGGAGATAADSWSVEDVTIREDAPDVAVAVAVTNDSGPDARTYVERHVPAVGRLLILRPANGPGRTAVRDGAHAVDLGDTFAAIVNGSRTSDERRRPLHVLAAVPHTVAFTMGRAGNRLGPTQMYEFALERNDPEGYSPSMLLNTA